MVHLDDVSTTMVRRLKLHQRIAFGWLCHVGLFSRLVIEKPLRTYQLEPAYAILDSVLGGRGQEQP